MGPCRRPRHVAPLRNKLHQDSLWAGLQAGSLSCVATDHCSFTVEQKRFGIGDFRKIPNGTGGLEDRMPLLWTYGVGTGRLTMSEFVAVTSTNIAKILNMYPRKGAIVEGADADIVVWDPKKKKTISSKSQQSVIDYNVFEGMEVTGLPRFVLTRGHLSIHDGKVDVQPGHGEFVEADRHRDEQGPKDRRGAEGHDHMPHRLPFRGAKIPGGGFQRGVHLAEAQADDRHCEGGADDDMADDDRQRVARQVDAAEVGQHRKAKDDDRDRWRQKRQRHVDLLARELVAIVGIGRAEAECGGHDADDHA